MSAQERAEAVGKPSRWELTVLPSKGHEKPGLEASPEPLRVLKAADAESRTLEFVADGSNSMEVKLVLRNAPLSFYFEDAEPESREIVLKPGESTVLKLKERLGLVQRKNLANRFTNVDSPYALVLKFDHPDLEDHGHGEHTDIHVEC